MYHDMFWGGMWFGWIFWIIIIALIVWLLIRQSNSDKQNVLPPGQESPLDLLKKRYAKGEITREQFLQMKNDLEGK